MGSTCATKGVFYPGLTEQLFGLKLNLCELPAWILQVAAVHPEVPLKPEIPPRVEQDLTDNDCQETKQQAIDLHVKATQASREFDTPRTLPEGGPTCHSP